MSPHHEQVDELMSVYSKLYLQGLVNTSYIVNCRAGVTRVNKVDIALRLLNYKPQTSRMTVVKDEHKRLCLFGEMMMCNCQ